MKSTIKFAMLFSILLMWGCGGGDDPPPGPVIPEDVYVVANTSVTIPAEMMNGLDAIWNSVSAYTIRIGEYSGRSDARIGIQDIVFKAINKDGILYIYANWMDSDANLRESYLNKESNNPSFPEWNRNVDFQGSDKFSIMFDAGNNGTEKANCATMCHGTTPNFTHYTTGGGNAEAWTWESSTTNPAFLADDMWWDDSGTDYDSPNLSDNDIYRNNFNPLGDLPYFYHETLGRNYTGDFLYTHDTVSFVLPGNWEMGDEIAGFVIDSMYHDTATVRDSRWDVLSYAEHDDVNGEWKVVLARALDTGNADDADLSTVDTVQVTIAINHNHPANVPNYHSASRPFYIILNP